MEGRRFHKNSDSDTVNGGPKGKPTSIILNAIATATKGSVSTSIILVQTRLSLPIRKFQTWVLWSLGN
nr:hypothetical protein CFP56_29210 [Quercus suber]